MAAVGTSSSYIPYIVFCLPSAPFPCVDPIFSLVAGIACNEETSQIRKIIVILAGVCIDSYQ